MHSHACACMHATCTLIAYAHTFHITHIIADGEYDRVWHRKLRRKGDSGQFNRLRSEEVKNWLNIDIWPGRLPFRTVEIIPGRLPGRGRSPFIPRK